jgi:hypothetical protein
LQQGQVSTSRIENCVAVWFRSRHKLGGDLSRCTGLILNNQRLLQRRPQTFRQNACCGIDGAPSRIGHDDVNGPIRIALRSCRRESYDKRGKKARKLPQGVASYFNRKTSI